MNITIGAGTKLGRYEIRSKIGEGGMGEVYRAYDESMNREVAIKVLAAALSADKARLSRFQQEAQTAGSLNHPNILVIHHIDSHDGALYIVSELLQGEELRDRLSQGQIPLRNVIDYAQQIASGLSAAHARGIVHRDLKPENLFITRDERVKILDFGLAKLSEPGTSATGSEDATRRALTNPGVVMGTVGYMSPEQVRGEKADYRSDIFSFGTILHEMITGRRAFRRETMAETMTAILREEPEGLSATNPNINPALEKIVRRCLEKKPERRFQSTSDLGFALEALSTFSSSGARQTEAALDSSSINKGWVWRNKFWQVAFAVAALTAIVLALTLLTKVGKTSPGVPVRRFSHNVPWKSAANWNDFDVAISPDGSQIAYNCREDNRVSLCLRSLDSLTVRRVTEARDAEDWFFSPDGEWLGMVDEVGLSKVSVRGGEPQPLHRWQDDDLVPSGFSWGPDGYILFGTPTGIKRIAASGGSPEQVSRVQPDTATKAHYWPSHVSDGQHVLITIIHADESGSAGLIDLKDGSVRDLGIRGENFVYVAPGWLAFKQRTTLLAVAFDLANPTRVGNPVPVIEDVGSQPHLAQDGTLVYIPTRGESSARLVWVDRDGRPTPVGGERLDYTHLDLDRDGRLALLNLHGGIDLIDLQTGTRKLVAKGSFPIWNGDGTRVTFGGDGGLQSALADGSGAPELLVKHPGFVVPTSWNRVTEELAYYDHRTFEIWIRSSDGKTRRFLGAPGRKRSGRFSPNGKWMAFVSDETGDYQVYVTAYPGPGPTVAVSTRGGLSPIWSGDGNELFFRLGSKVLAARMSTTTPLTFTTPVEIFDGPYTLDLMGHQREAVTGDGRRFLMVENSDDFPILIVQNWAQELERLVR